MAAISIASIIDDFPEPFSPKMRKEVKSLSLEKSNFSSFVIPRK